MTAQGATTVAQLNTQPERGHAMARKTKVRTTFTPGTVIEVDAAELLDLERQGLIYSRELAKGEKPRKGEKSWDKAKPEPTESGVVTDTTPAELAEKREAAKP